MTHMETESVTCPECGKEAVVNIHSTLNVTLDPKLRDDLFNFRINLFRCPSCGKEAIIGSPLLYHDMDRAFAIQYYPGSYLDEAEFIEQFDGDPLTRNDDLGLVSTDKMPRHLSSPHIVFDLDELRRYIVFREKLFERRRTQSV